MVWKLENDSFSLKLHKLKRSFPFSGPLTINIYKDDPHGRFCSSSLYYFPLGASVCLRPKAILLFVCSWCTAFIDFPIASGRRSWVSAGVLLAGRGVDPKTRSVGQRPPGLTVSFTAWTAIFKQSASVSVRGIASRIYKYATRKGPWYISTWVMVDVHSTGAFFIVIPSVSALSKNSLETKLLP